ncbi:glycoside hydrolase family 28 protein [Uliginosibacterium sediminicola]|uniref:Glycosyl hydrolase family 28 protein n=1 Tax=Uliginosibacterium sediminicola TaxID=2024550 RepID=A0ABU9YZH8_9RHOO
MLLKNTALPLLLTLALASFSTHAANTCSLPKEQGTQDDTALLQQSIDACAKQGGGTLALAGRTYTIGPIQLRSHVYLVLAPETLILGTTDKSRYQPAFIGWPYRSNEALISGYQISDSGIIGSGRIDGQGSAWWDEARTQRKDRLYPDVPDANGMPRPWLVEFYDSSNISIDGPTLQNSPMWNLALRYSKDVTIKNLRIHNPKEAANTDGIDIVSSQNVSVQHAEISTGDDNITIKSGLAPYAMPRQAAANISIRDVKFGDGHGFSIGSETFNGIHHVSLDGASFEGTTNGIRIKTGRDRGAEIAYIDLKNIHMQHVGMPLSITAYYPNVPAERGAPQALSATTPHIHDVTISQLQAEDSKSAGRFIGLPEAALQGIHLQDVSISAKTGLSLRDASIDASKLQLHVSQGEALIKNEQGILNQH